MFQLLTSDQLSAVHASSLRVLESVGILIEEDQALNVLESSGAQVDHRKRVARIPQYLVKETIRKTPKSIYLGARNQKHDLHIEKGSVHTRPASGYTQVLDSEGDFRKATTKDLEAAIIVIDSLENISFASTCILPSDVPTELNDVFAVRIALGLTEKHLFFSPLTRENFDYCIRMAVAVQGSEEEFKKRPLVSFIAATTSPLKLPREPALQLIECARMKVPVMLDSSPMCGATGPASLLGALVLQNAEDLAMNALIQLVNPNSPVTYGPRCAPLDMRTGMPSWGSVEMALLSAGGVQIAHYYGIPADTHGPTTNSKLLDEQAGFEKAICGMMPALAGSEIISGAGALESLSTSSIEQLIIDDEFYSMLFRLVKGLEVDDDTLAVDLIRKVAHEGAYLKEEHTRRHYKQEHRLPLLFDAQFRNAWQSAGAKDTVQRAKEKARKILSEHHPIPLGAELEKRLDILLDDAKRTILKS